jgi:hypothetical protein
MDAFQLLHDARKSGARAALYGRKINNAEHQLTFITHLRHIIDGHLAPADAVRAYHADLEKLGIKPYRDLKSDLELTTTASSYAGTSTGPARRKPTTATTTSSATDFARMTPAQKLAYNRARIRGET